MLNRRDIFIGILCILLVIPVVFGQEQSDSQDIGRRDIAELNKNVKDLNENVETLNSTTDDLNENVKTLNSTTDDLNENVETLNVTTGGMNEKITRIELETGFVIILLTIILGAIISNSSRIKRSDKTNNDGTTIESSVSHASQVAITTVRVENRQL